ncbi:hypothetical protein KCU77_g7175, partial [Aureobasidium melanogenum]
MSLPTEPPFERLIKELDQATANISLESRLSYQRPSIPVPGAARSEPQDFTPVSPDPQDAMNLDPNSTEQNWQDDFDRCTHAAYTLVDQWELSGHPTQPRDPDPVEYDVDHPNYKPVRGDIIADGKIFRVHTYFGEEWSDIIRGLNTVEPFETDMLTTELLPHQKYGVAKVLKLFEGPCYGGILGDEMGLGKTLMSILSIKVDRMQPKRRGCFALVIAPLSTHSQWVTECEHFKPEHRPVPFKLDDSTTTAEKLLEMDPDFVIVTPQFVESQYRRWALHEDFKSLVDQEGYAAACQKHPLGKDGGNLVSLSLYSSVYANRLLPFTHVIVDEAHYAKDTEGSTHKAIERLYRTRTLLVSGTFMSNRWNDIFAFLHLLPGHPFHTKADFERSFGHDNRRPATTRFDLLVKFLQAIVIARPNSVLQLKDATVIDYPFRLSQDDEDEVYFLMILWYRAIQRLKNQRKNLTKVQTKEMSQRVLSLVMTAQVCAGHPNLSDALAGDEKKTRKQVKDAMKAFKERYDAAWIEHGNEEPTEPSLAVYDEKVRRAHALFQEDLIKIAGIVPTAYKPTKKAPRTRDQWLKYVKNLYKDGDIWSARVQTIHDLVIDVRKKKPNEKIVIFSKYIKFLDLLAEVFAHMEGEPSVYRFDGTQTPVRRELTRFMYTTADEKEFCIMLVTAGAGGAGINLSAASVVIQCEGWWNMNEERQAWFRVRRPDQEKAVTIYRLFAENSLVDFHTQTVRDAKAETIDKFMEKLRREDHEQPEIPSIVPYY